MKYYYIIIYVSSCIVYNVYNYVLLYDNNYNYMHYIYIIVFHQYNNVYVCMYTLYMCVGVVCVCVCMYVCICMYVYMYVCIYVCMYVCMYVGMYMYLYVCNNLVEYVTTCV